MSLTADIISQFVKATNDTSEKKSEATVNGTIVEYGGDKYVQLDGSELLTPISTTTDTEPGERVTVLIKNHTATVTGNLSSPAARTETVKELGNAVTQVEILVADKVSTEQLDAEIARIDELVAANVTITGILEANEADIIKLKAKDVEIEGTLTANEAIINKLQTDKLDVGVADITYATIKDLEAVSGDFYTLEATYATFSAATIEQLNAHEATITNLDATHAKIDFANVTFANISEAKFEEFFAATGLIENAVISQGTVTGNLKGVTIEGDLIKAGTLKADRLILQGVDGLYYELNATVDGVTAEQLASEEYQNALHGSNIIAHTITAEQLYVDDLVAFGASIGGFELNTDSIHSKAKETIDSTVRGIYFDTSGQFAVGDETNYIRFYGDEDGVYRLDISAASITFGDTSNSLETEISDIINKIGSNEDNISSLTDDLGAANSTLEQLKQDVDEIGELRSYIHMDKSTEIPIILLGTEANDFRVAITNQAIDFMNGGNTPTSVSHDGLETDNIEVRQELRHGDFLWKQRKNGNYGLQWKEVAE